MTTSFKIVYSPKYDIKFFGLEKQHPFDSCKYSRAWRELSNTFGKRLNQYHLRPIKPVHDSDLRLIHTETYLKALTESAYVSRALELPFLARAPLWLLERHLLFPMRLATQGTVMAARSALETGGLAVNLSGGYHHASSEKGEGFCLYGDVCLAIAQMRAERLLIPGQDRVLYIDLDAHQGNGVERLCVDDPDVSIFDMYNAQIYPRDGLARKRIDLDVPLPSGTSDATYLRLLEEHIDVAIEVAKPKLAFYNAGTDIYFKDALGGLDVSGEGVLARDSRVLDALRAANIPSVMVLSGGYSRDSYLLVSQTLRYLIEQSGDE